MQNLRRQSKGYQKTSSQFRGVTRHQKGKWEARIGQMVGKKYKCGPSHSLIICLGRASAYFPIWILMLTAMSLRTCPAHVRT